MTHEKFKIGDEVWFSKFHENSALRFGYTKEPFKILDINPETDSVYVQYNIKRKNGETRSQKDWFSADAFRFYDKFLDYNEAQMEKYGKGSELL